MNIFILFFIVFILILLIIWIWYYPHFILFPLNFLYNFDPSPRTIFYTDSQIDEIFPVHKELESVWSEIKSEGYNLYDILPNKSMNYLDYYNINIGHENTKNWTTIPLRLFGRDCTYYMDKCSILSLILRMHPEIKSCLFSIMHPNKIIQSHYGPYDGLIRYQLPLDIPITSMSEECYLHVADEICYWQEGKGIMFDESKLHGAINTTKSKRMVLLIDLERPYYLIPFRLLNKLIIWIMGSLPETRQIALV